MPLAGLAHAMLRVPDVDAALAFHRDVLGLVEIERTEDAVYLSAGLDGGYDLALTRGGTGVDHFAFRVDDADDLAYYTRLLAEANVPVSTAQDEEPGVGKAIRFSLPSGHTMEIAAIVPNPAYPYAYGHPANPAYGRGQGIAPRDVDHITLRVPDVEQNVAFLTEVLGFHAADARRMPDGRWRAAWLHVSAQHHDLALMRGAAGESLDHLAWLVDGIEQMKRAADLLAQVGLRGEVGPGRHSIGGNLFFYFWTADGNRYELSAEMSRVEDRRAKTRVWEDGPGLFSPWGVVPPESFQRGS
jgi:catechol 2,3-dioxygenase